MSMKLRDLIRKVRQCKTASEERAVIAKESAMIRTAIREEQVHYRHRNVAKLLFMHMLGYPTHFGQLECMKLTASPHFPEKRIGYLGMLLLLSEEAEVLMLATNALKSDLVSENKFVAGLALVAIGNLATADMSRDLAPEVDKHLKSPLAYLRKKACLAMARCLSKCPDMVEDFVERVTSLLKDKSHGVLVTVVQLLTQVLLIDYETAVQEGEVDPLNTDCRRAFLQLVPTLVKMLRNLLGSSGGSAAYMTDHEVAGISDPFLQVQLLTLLRLLGTGNRAASEEMNDVLAQVATNTETAKNAGNAILYECVLCIMGVESEDGLRVLAVNILGRFLLNRDNNIRYVALNTLAKCVLVEQDKRRDETTGTLTAAPNIDPAEGTQVNNAMSALQRHRTTVVDCLKDADVSIRQRALELVYHLVNPQNVQQLTGELLNYLVLCPREHKADISDRILKILDVYGNDAQQAWRVDTLITTLTLAGREATRPVQSATVLYISVAPAATHAVATHKLTKALRDDDGSQHGLLNVGIWCMGEYGDLLLQPCTAPDGTTYQALDPLTVVDTLETIVQRQSCPPHVHERALTAYAKLAHRFAAAAAETNGSAAAAAVTKLESLLQHESTHKSLEVQLRACEYQALVSASKGIKPPKLNHPKPQSDETNNNSMEADLFGMGAADDTNGSANETLSPQVIAAAKEALARMPVVEARILQKRIMMQNGNAQMSSSGSSVAGDEIGDNNNNNAPVAAAPASTAGDDLLDLFGGSPAPAPAAPSNGNSAAPVASLVSQPGGSGGGSDMELLADIFASSAASSSSQPALAEPTSTSSAAVDIFGATPTPPSSTTDLFGAAPAAAAPVNNNLFGGPAPAATSTDLFGAASATAAPPAPAPPAPAAVNPLDLFGAPAAPAAAPSITPSPPTGGQTTTTTTTTSQPAAQAQQSAGSGDLFGTAAPQAPSPAATAEEVRVPAITKDAVSVEFVCTKPDAWNKQKSTLVAHFVNKSHTPVHGVHLQVAVPKHVQMDMEPASATTVPPGGKTGVTQKVHVTNTLLGTKNLALKLKISFSQNGQKVEHLATCNAFPAGQY